MNSSSQIGIDHDQSSKISSSQSSSTILIWFLSNSSQLRQYQCPTGGWSELSRLSQQVWQQAYQQYSHSSSRSKSSFLPQIQQGQSKGSSNSSLRRASSTGLTLFPWRILVKVALQQGHLFENLLLSKIQVQQKVCLQLSLPMSFSSSCFKSPRQIEHSLEFQSLPSSLTLLGTVANLLNFFFRHSGLVFFFMKTRLQLSDYPSYCCSQSSSLSSFIITASCFIQAQGGAQRLPFKLTQTSSEVEPFFLLFYKAFIAACDPTLSSSSSMSLSSAGRRSMTMVAGLWMSLNRLCNIIINYKDCLACGLLQAPDIKITAYFKFQLRIRTCQALIFINWTGYQDQGLGRMFWTQGKTVPIEKSMNQVQFIIHSNVFK